MLTPPPTTKEQSVEELIRHNGELVEALLASEGWKEVVLPLIQESVSSVSGRYTSGYYYDGEFTRGGKSLDYLSGYQKALMELNNRILDFVKAKDNLVIKKKAEAKEANAPMINPFLEDEQ